MIQRFLGALQFLTVLPMYRETASPGEAAVFFPLIGAMLGAAAGAVMQVFRHVLGQSVAALLAIAVLMAITGCLHEDGLADVADAVRAGRSREKMMAILKDSRIGTYGAVALIVSFALRWQSIAQTSVNPLPGLVAALALSRTSLVALAALAPSIGTGLGQAFAASCSRPVLIVTGVQSVAITGLMAVFIGWHPAAALIAASATVVLLARHYFMRHLGGVNGDCLGATCQAVEVVNLLVLACHPSI